MQRGPTYHAIRSWRTLKSLVPFMFRARPDDVLLASVNDGLGAFYQIPFVLWARLRGLRTFLHHHSFRYTNEQSRLMSLFCRLSGSRARHVFLCRIMQKDFEARYPTSGRNSSAR